MELKNITVCPVCNADTMLVVDSRRNKDMRYEGSIYRRRKCSICGYRLTTYEVAKEDADKITKLNSMAREFEQLIKGGVG